MYILAWLSVFFFYSVGIYNFKLIDLHIVKAKENASCEQQFASESNL